MEPRINISPVQEGFIMLGFTTGFFFVYNFRLIPNMSVVAVG